MALPLDAVYGALALFSFLLALVFVPAARLFGKTLGFVDAVNPAKIHREPMVRCGGLGIWLAFMASLGIALGCAGLASERFLPAPLAEIAPNIVYVVPKLSALLAGATLLFLVGLADDRRPLPPLPKLLLQIVSALPLIAAGITIKAFVPGEIPAALMTVAWVVLLTNAFNFLDNMDGLSAGVAAVALFNFYIISRAGGELFMMAMFALLFGAVCGFLVFNFPRARLFMGDSGSLFIGYMLAALSAMVTYYEAGVPTQLPVVAPLIVLGVPLFDTVSVLLIRWRNGAPLMKGDLNHFSHRLVALGFSRTQAVVFIHVLTLTVGLTAVNLRHLDWPGACLALVQVVLFFVAIHLLERAARATGEKERMP